MRCLVVINSREFDVISYKIIETLKEKNCKIGVYDTADSINENVKNAIGLNINPITTLSDAIVEYYEVAYCMYSALPQIRNYNIFTFSYYLNTTHSKVANLGADFLFVSDGVCVGDTPYVQMGVPSTVDVQNMADVENTNLNIYVDKWNKYTLGGINHLAESVLETIKEGKVKAIKLFVEDPSASKYLGQKFEENDAVEVLSCGDMLLEKEVSVLSDEGFMYACIYGMKVSKYEGCYVKGNEKTYQENDSFVLQIADVLMQLGCNSIADGEYPKGKEYKIDELLKNPEIDIEVDIQKLIFKRWKNYIIAANNIVGMMDDIDITTYLDALNEIVVENSFRNKIVDKENLLSYFVLKQNEELFLKQNLDTALAIYLQNELYDSMKKVVDGSELYDAKYYFINGICAYQNLEYVECIEFFKQYIACLEKQEYSVGYFDKLENLEMVKLYTFIAGINVDIDGINVEELLVFLDGTSNNQRFKIYDMLIKKSCEDVAQGRYQECLKRHALYDLLIKRVGQDKAHVKHRYQYHKNMLKLYKNNGKKAKMVLSAVQLCKYAVGIVLKKIKEKLDDPKNKKRIKNFIFRCKKYLKRKCKEVMVFFHIYGKEERKLLQYKNKYAGKRCFVIGNGPSLRLEDLEKIRENGDYSFACNKIYKVFDKTEWRPTFYACTDSAVFRQNYYSILSQKEYQKFFGANLPMQEEIKADPKNISVNYATKAIEKTKFAPNATFIYSGGTVTYVLITLAWMMGFREIYIIGCDHSYGFFSGSNSGSVESTSDTNNDYFMKNYMRPGEKINIGNLDRSEQGYIIARKFIESHGGKIYNATRGGKLEAFERKDLDEVLNAVNQ